MSSILPLGDAGRLGPALARTRRLAIALAACLAALGAAAFLLAPRPTGQLGSLVASGQPTVVALDVSRSVSDLVYQEIARTLEGIATSAGPDGQVGLVLFSDQALEALAPATRASELAPFARYFRPHVERGATARPVRLRTVRSGGPDGPDDLVYPLAPWDSTFSGGTRISAGLRVARESLERAGAAAGRVILISDLAEAEEDRSDLTAELLTYSGRPLLDLRVVELPSSRPNERPLFERLRGDGVVSSLALATGGSGRGEPAASASGWFLACVGLLAVLAAAGLLLLTPVRFAAPARLSDRGGAA